MASKSKPVKPLGDPACQMLSDSIAREPGVLNNPEYFALGTNKDAAHPGVWFKTGIKIGAENGQGERRKKPQAQT